MRKFIIILDFENNENSKIDKYSENNINLDLNIKKINEKEQVYRFFIRNIEEFKE